MAALIQEHNGRVVNAPGDALLAEFESVVDAVKTAVEIQRELSRRNADLPPDRRMEYGIGINLGDVMVDGDSIYGDGVNIAARLQSLADAGGICISGTAFDRVKNKLNLGYEYLGEQTVKNILEPVRVYRVLMEPEAAGKVIGKKKNKTQAKAEDGFNCGGNSNCGSRCCRNLGFIFSSSSSTRGRLQRKNGSFPTG
jgi:adenylate cyclase